MREEGLLAMQPTIRGRLERFRAEPGEARPGSFGDYPCGCQWDSGPLCYYCEGHDHETLLRCIVAEFVRAIKADDRLALDEAVAVAEDYFADSEGGM